MKLKTAGFSFLAALLLQPAVYAQAHPHSVNARTYLRTAQLLMRVPEQPNVQLTMKPADDELEEAVKEMDRAAAVERKDMVDHPHIDGDLTRVDQFRSIVELLHAARNEIGAEEANSASQWRSGVLKHIDAALEGVHRAAIDARLDREIGSF
jgi:hypothetical protein